MRKRYACVEVVDRDANDGSLTIVSGYGAHSQWYRNLVVHPDIKIRIGRARRAVHAELLSPADGADAMADYARRYARLTQPLSS